MKNITARLLALSLLALCLTSTAAPPKGHQIIVGHAQARRCSTPIGGGDGPPPDVQCITWSVPSVVDVYTADFRFVTRVTTDTDGFFTVRNLRPGTYALIVSAITPRAGAGRYFPVVQTVTFHGKQATPLDFYLRYQAD